MAAQFVGISPGPPVLADFSHDGKLDAVYASATNTMVLKGHGDGTFEATGLILPAPVIQGQNPGVVESIATGDFDGDGNLDIAELVEVNSNDIPSGYQPFELPSFGVAAVIYYGNGDGTFSAPVIAGISASLCHAQIPSVTDTTATPVPNAGHDYIQGMQETVNPANGSLSIRIGVPMPPARGVTVPFSFAYDSNGSLFLGTPLCGGCTEPTSGVTWLTTNSMLSHGGWSYSVPMLSVQDDRFSVQYTLPNEQEATFVCHGRDNFVFQDEGGSRHNLGLSYYNSNAYCQNSDQGGQAVQVLTSLYGKLLAQTSGTWTQTASNALGSVNPVTVTDASGTSYTFGSAPAPGSNTCNGSPCTATTYPPSTISDANGNTANITSTEYPQGNPALTYTDSIGRPVLSIPTFGASQDAISVSGYANPYKVTWTTVQPNYTVDMELMPGTSGTCAYPSTQPSIPAIASITLPNGEAYTFDYSNNPYGMVDKITYPTGAYVRYTWELNHQSEVGQWPIVTNGANGPQVTGECYYYYDTPVIYQRFVSYDGVHEVLEQTFSYQTNWNQPPADISQWSSKATSVLTQDLIRQTQTTTSYTYGPVYADSQPSANQLPQPPQLPVETSIQYNSTVPFGGGSGAPLKTVSKTWLNERIMTQEKTELANGQTSTTNWQYYPTTGTGGFYSAASLAGVNYDGSSEFLESESDYDYGGSTLLRETIFPCYEPFGSTIVENKPEIVAVEHGSGILDAERGYIYDSRGNLTTRFDWIGTGGSGFLSGGSNCPSVSTMQADANSTSTVATSHGYDSYGNITSSTDAAGHTTTYSYTNSFADTCSYTPAASAYLTAITYPATAGAPNPDQETFQYYCATGELAKSTDENNNTTSYQYEPLLERLSTITYPSGWGTETINYDDTPGALSVETKRLDGSGSRWSDEVDLVDGMFHQLSKSMANAQGGWNRTDTCYDGAGQVMTSVYPYQTSNDSTQPQCPTTGSRGSIGAGDTFVYDALGRQTSQTHSDGTVIATSYSSRAADVKDEGNGARSVERVSQSDALGRLTSVCEVTSSTQNGVSPAACGLDSPGTGFLTTYSYDGAGNLTNVTQGGESRSFVYDKASRLTSSTNPETGTITYTYDSNTSCPAPNNTDQGMLISKTDGRGISTCYQYDARERVTEKRYSDGTPVATYNYNETAARGRSLTNTVGRLSSESTGGTYPTGSVFSYDAMGDVIDNSQCTPYNCGSGLYSLTYAYNVLGGPLTLTNGSNYSLTYNYTDGQLTSLGSSLNDSNHPGTLLSGVVYNAFGSPLSGVIGTGLLNDTRIYDVRDRLTSISVANSSATPSTGSLTINGSEQSSGGPTPATGSASVGGTEQSGTLCQDSGKMCRTVYDTGSIWIVLNGVTYSTTYGESSTPSALASSLASSISRGGAATATVNGSTINITTVAKGSGANYSYSSGSSTNNPSVFDGASFSVFVSGASLSGGQNTSSPYDTGTVTLTINGSPVSANYGQYDTPATVAASLALQINNNSSFVSANASGSTVSLTSKSAGAYTDYSLSTSDASSNGFNPPSFSASLSGSSMTGGTGGSIYSAGISYEPNGSVENSSDSVNGNWTYTYDDFDRLNTAVSNTGLGCSEAYDRYGNRLQQNTYQGSCYTPQYTSNGNNNRLDQFVYDGAGNVIGDSTNVYTYDAESRVATVNTPGGALIATYVYDAEGRRVRKIASADTEDDIYDPWGHMISAFSTAGGWQRGELFAGNQHLATYINGTTYFNHADWEGTERVRSTVSAGIQPGSEWTSYPFGEGSPNPNPGFTHFTGKIRDQESGNDYFGARYYGSGAGRFLTPDWSAKVEPVPYSKLDDPQSLNLYDYVRNNPVTTVDLDGHMGDPASVFEAANMALFPWDDRSPPDPAQKGVPPQQPGAQQQSQSNQPSPTNNNGPTSAVCSEDGPHIVRDAAVTALSKLNPGQDETNNITPSDGNFAKVADPSKVDTKTWTDAASAHGTSKQSPTIPGQSTFVVKLYVDPKRGNIIAVVYPNGTPQHMMGLIPFLMGSTSVNVPAARAYMGCN